MSMAKRTVLIAGMGTSPAVLTETVWALAHQKKPVVPDEIVVIAANNVVEKFRSEILEGKPSVWERLLTALEKDKINANRLHSFGRASVRLIPDAHGNELEDLRSGSDNLLAADFMLKQVRQYTESPDTEVIASIAGGRKTMSALLFSCMTLLGRECDKVIHVLLPPALDGGSVPPFYFPERGKTYTSVKSGKRIKSDKLQSEVFEVPFVRMRGWYQEKFKSIPPTYQTLVEGVQQIAPAAVAIPSVEIDAWNGMFRVDGIELHPGALEFSALVMLANGISNPEKMFRCFCRIKSERRSGGCDWLERVIDSPKFSGVEPDDWRMANQEISKVMSRLRQFLLQNGIDSLSSLIPMRGRNVTYPINRIVWHGKKQIVDICSYLFQGSE